jgi:hypothetical protein
VKKDPGLLHPLILKQLRTTMCFLVRDQGTLHAATIVRVPSAEFTNTIETTPMRLHVGLWLGVPVDMFFFYVIVADEKDLWWTETWIFPYDDERIGPAPNDPLAKDGRKRLSQLFKQEFSYCLIVDENNNLRCARKIFLTASQKKAFPILAKTLKDYEGKRISLVQVQDAIDRYTDTISKPKLERQFEGLLSEK